MTLLNSIPLLSGFIIALMVTINTSLSKSIGETYSVFIIHFTGLLVLLVFCAASRNKISFSKKIPLWIYLGGVLGIFVVSFNNLTIQNIGVSLALSLGIAGQIITSIILEHIGFLGTLQNRFNISKLPGVILILVGSILIII